MPAAKPELRDECVRLRLEERKTYREIASLTGASKGSLSLWLSGHSLTESERENNLRRSPTTPKKDRGVESEIHKKVRGNHLNGVQVAKVSEAAVLLRMLILGFNVFGSAFDGDKTDWLVEVPATEKIYKVQVKTAYQGRTGLPSVSLCFGAGRARGGRYKKGDFDFIMGYNIFTDITYVWSWADVEGHKTAITVCPEAEEAWEKLTG